MSTKTPIDNLISMLEIAQRNIVASSDFFKTAAEVAMQTPTEPNKGDADKNECALDALLGGGKIGR